MRVLACPLFLGLSFGSFVSFLSLGFSLGLFLFLFLGHHLYVLCFLVLQCSHQRLSLSTVHSFFECPSAWQMKHLGVLPPVLPPPPNPTLAAIYLPPRRRLALFLPHFSASAKSII